jgi:hypothetical protein
MGVYEGRGQLAKSMKELMSRWQETRQGWDDPMSRSFEKECLLPIEQDLRNAFGAMEHIAQVLAQVRKDCE